MSRHVWNIILLALVSLVAMQAGCSQRAQKDRPAVAEVSRAAPGVTLAQDAGRWWLTAPDGQKFFSLGICCVNQGTAKDHYDPENPSYAAWQHYPDGARWAEASINRLSSWGFTTAGGWSDFDALRQSKNHKLWLTPVLHMGSTSGLPWWDMWDQKNIARMEEVAAKHILSLRDDPRLLGYYSDNELGWWNAALWKMTLQQPASSGQRRRLMALLRETYGDDWQRLMADFESDVASSFKELEQKGLLFLRPGGDGIRVMRRFLVMLAERYYQLTHDIIRKYDRRALILGDRYQSFFYPEVVQAAARHVDVVSTNLNAAWNDGTFPPFQLDTLHHLTGKPLIVSEFYMAAAKNRSGNRNTQGQFPLVQTQEERARSARTTLMRLMGMPYIVGVDWFQYSDEPTHGRYDAENFNFGLVDIHDRPYEQLTEVFASLDVKALRGGASPATEDASTGIPPAPADPLEDFAPLRAIKNWNRQRGFAKPVSPAPLADLYVCWKANALYLAVHAWDLVETDYYRGSVPKEDRALWTVALGGREIVRARIGAGREALVSNASVRVESIPVATSSVWNTAVMEIPAKLLEKQQLRAGDKITLDCTLLTHARAYRMQWKGTFTLGD